jgi:succinate-semialdehyde dehydrogenase / glutarate-semialdehyde dehydrogenase
VAAKAGSEIKKTVLELGGSDPYLVLEDADLEAAAETCVASRLINSGQSCIAAKRFLVVDAVAESSSGSSSSDGGRPHGRPASTRATTSARRPAATCATRCTAGQRSVAAGAKLVLGGELPEGAGAFYPPTVLTEVRPGMPAFDEEVFGPAAADAGGRRGGGDRLANQLPFGLGAAVFTADLERGEAIARRLEAGCCFVNAAVKSDPRLPFGMPHCSSLQLVLLLHRLAARIYSQQCYQ